MRWGSGRKETRAWRASAGKVPIQARGHESGQGVFLIVPAHQTWQLGRVMFDGPPGRRTHRESPSSQPPTPSARWVEMSTQRL